jgi:hypothetical protein
MQKHEKQLKIANLLFGLILIVYVLYYEPFVISQSSFSDVATRIDRVYSIESVDITPEVVVDKAEQIVSTTIRCSFISSRDIVRKILKKDSLQERKVLGSSILFLPAFCVSCALIIDFEFGANIKLRNIISYILSQIGL